MSCRSDGLTNRQYCMENALVSNLDADLYFIMVGNRPCSVVTVTNNPYIRASINRQHSGMYDNLYNN